MIHTKNCLECGNSFETNRKDKAYCTDQCKSLAFYKRKAGSGMNGLGNSTGPDLDGDDNDLDDKVKAPPSSSYVKPTSAKTIIQGLGVIEQYMLSDKDRQIDFYKTAYEEERSKRKKVKGELATITDELRELKMSNKIAEVSKPKGLNGLASNLEPFINHPLVIAMGQRLMGMGPMQMEGVGGEGGGANQLAPLITWINGLSDEARHAFAMLVTELSKTEDQQQLTTVLDRLVNIVTGGSTIGSNPKATAQASGTFNY